MFIINCYHLYLTAVLDTKRIEDGVTVCVKVIYRTPSEEAKIVKCLSSAELSQERTDHSVPSIRDA